MTRSKEQQEHLDKIRSKAKNGLTDFRQLANELEDLRDDTGKLIETPVTRRMTYTHLALELWVKMEAFEKRMKRIEQKLFGDE